jgi:Protein of unknown function (DUF2971)
MGVILKILQTKELWASNVKYLNDVSEHQLFLDAAERRISECIPEIGSLNLRYSTEERSAADALPGFLQLPFVISFSRQDDLLTHWRSYCSAGNGVSIGFRTASLQAAEVRKPNSSFTGMIVPHPRFGEVSYIDPNNNEIVDDMITTSYRDAIDFIAQNHHSPDVMTNELTGRLTSAASFFKDYSFENEREFRLIVDGISWRQDLLCFRTARSTLIPYVPLVIPTYLFAPCKIGEPEPHRAWNAISSITVGPTPNISLSVEAVLAYCSVNGVYPTVNPSRVPYRDW